MIPNVPIAFYSFHIMVALGFYFLLLLALVLLSLYRGKIENRKFLLWYLPVRVGARRLQPQGGKSAQGAAKAGATGVGVLIRRLGGESCPQITPINADWEGRDRFKVHRLRRLTQIGRGRDGHGR
ncbi:MAG: cytochrome ubiquinol oxidase subunit I [Kiritimatiellia bacterium]